MSLSQQPYTKIAEPTAKRDILSQRSSIGPGMDGKGRWVENALVERPRRSVKYDVLKNLRARDSPIEANTVLERDFDFCNARRPHQGAWRPDGG